VLKIKNKLVIKNDSCKNPNRLKKSDFYKDLKVVMEWINSIKYSKKQNENDVKLKRE
jgi:hypothetical protein